MYELGLGMMLSTLSVSVGGDAAVFFEHGPFRSGFISREMSLDLHIQHELAIREPSMCDGGAMSWVSWSRLQNKVVVGGIFDGLPYRPLMCHETDPSTDYNQYPMCVEDGQWQIWFLGRLFTRTSVFYYDEATGTLLGNEFELLQQPEGSIPVDIPVAQMVCTETFESDPEHLFAAPFFELDYDQILDSHGTGGALATFLPFNLYEPDEIEVYYVEGGLPLDEAMHMDDVLDDLDEGIGGVVIALSYEPVPKPPDLIAINNAMTGWGSTYPEGAFPEVEPPNECGTYQVPGP